MKFFFLFLCALSMLACGKNAVSSDQPAIIAAKRSLEFAEKDGVELGQYSIRSVMRLGYGDQALVDQSANSAHIKKVRFALKNKNYWEVCYEILSDEVVGATYCYYHDELTYELLTVYRSK